MKFPDNQPGVQPIINYLGYHPMQPKAEIAVAMAKLGFRIPQLFDGIDDAIRSGEAFIARSEGPDELYHSGLKASIDSRSPLYDERELRSFAQRLSDPERNYKMLANDYNRLGARGVASAGYWYYLAQKLEDSKGNHSMYDDEFARQHSLSYWQVVEGDNYYIIGDTALEGRYYIGRLTKGRQGFTIVDGDEVRHEASWYRQAGGEAPNTDKLIEFYESVRRAPLFDGQNIPLVELVDPGDGEEPVFLQYLPTHPRVNKTPHITSPQSDVVFVRGATPPEGYTGVLEDNIFQAYGNEAQREGSLILSPDRGGEIAELMLPRIDVNILSLVDEFTPETYLLRNGWATIDHGTRSTTYKPKVTLALSKLAMDFLRQRQDERRYESIPLTVKADGKSAEVYAQIGNRRVGLHELRHNLKNI
ncbi:MAG: hypothetical protein KA604_00070 [Candidatus Saccharimonas sp.]|nr:hypothetical protein [Candidatus Saccharimonas sp.]